MSPVRSPVPCINLGWVKHGKTDEISLKYDEMHF